MSHTGKGKAPKVLQVLIYFLILFLVIWAQICPDLLQPRLVWFPNPLGLFQGRWGPCLNLVPHSSTSLEPPEVVMATKWPNLGPFGPFRGPMAPPMATSDP